MKWQQILPWLGLILILICSGCAQPESSLPNSVVTGDGWQTLSGQDMIISLPDTYKGGNPNQVLNTMKADLGEINPTYRERIARIAQNADSIALLAFDTKDATSGVVTNVNVVFRDRDPQKTIAVYEYIQPFIQELQNEVKVNTLKRQEAVEIIVDSEELGQLVYVTSDKAKFWLITYTTSPEKFAQELPNFRRSLKTFQSKSTEID